MRNHTITVTIENDDGEEENHDLHAKKEVCPECEGFGTVLNEGMRGHAYSMEEFQEAFDDEEQEEYFKPGGMYDVTCHVCYGEKVIDVIDEEACNRDPKLKQILEDWDEQEQERARWKAEERYLRKMGY